MSNFPRSPFSLFFNHFTFKLKFALMLACLISALLVSLLYIWNIQKRHVQQAERGLRGIAYQKALRKTWEDLLTYTLILKETNATDEESSRSDLVKKQALLTEDFNHIKMMQEEWLAQAKQRAPEFDVQERPFLNPDALAIQWQRAREDLYHSPNKPGSENDLKKLIVDLSKLNLFIANASHLTQDSDEALDSLLKIISVHVPEIQENVVNLTKLNSKTNLDKSLLDVKKHILLEKIKKTDETLKTSLNYALEQPEKDFQNESPGNWQEKVSIAWNTYQKILSHFIADSEITLKPSTVTFGSVKGGLLNTKEPDTSSAQRTNQEIPLQAIQLLESTFLLWDLSMLRTQEILQLRQGLSTELKLVLLSILGLGLLGTLIGLLLRYQMSRSFDGALNFLKSDTNQETPLPVYFNDEIGKICCAYNVLVEKTNLAAEKLYFINSEGTETFSKIGLEIKNQHEITMKQEGIALAIASSASQIQNATKDASNSAEIIRNSSLENSMIALQANESINAVEQVIEKMVGTSSSISAKLSILNEKARMIVMGIATIAKVADQTNLLSLNAAIEAEKAGEQGRSFSVIAEEIRRLADQTTNAIMDIERTVSEMTVAVSQGVEGMQLCKDEIRVGSNKMQEVSKLVSKIADRTKGYLPLLDQIARGLETQDGASKTILETIEMLNQLSDQSNNVIKNFNQSIGLLIKNNASAKKIIDNL